MALLILFLTALQLLAPYVPVLLATAKVMTACGALLSGIAALIWACRRRR